MWLVLLLVLWGWLPLVLLRLWLLGLSSRVSGLVLVGVCFFSPISMFMGLLAGGLCGLRVPPARTWWCLRGIRGMRGRGGLGRCGRRCGRWLGT